MNQATPKKVIHRRAFFSTYVKACGHVGSQIFVRLFIVVLMSYVLTISTLYQAYGATSARAVRAYRPYTTMKIRPLRSGLHAYELVRPDGKRIAVTGMPDILGHVNYLTREHKVETVKIEFEGFKERPKDEEALAFSIRNALSGSVPFALLTASELSFVEKPGSKNQKRAVEAKTNRTQGLPAVTIVTKGEITRDLLNGGYKSDLKLRSHGKDLPATVYANSAFLIQRFIELLESFCAEIVYRFGMSEVTEERDVRSAVISAKQTLARERGMTYEELTEALKVDLGNGQMVLWDLVPLAALTK